MNQDRLETILELILINQLRQTDLIMAAVTNATPEQIQEIILAHSKGQLIGDMPYMVREDSPTAPAE